MSHHAWLFIERKRVIDSSATENQDSLILNNEMADYLLLCSEVIHIVLKLRDFSVLTDRSSALRPLLLPSDSHSLSSVDEKMQVYIKCCKAKCTMCLLKITRNDWKTCSYEIGMELTSGDILVAARVMLCYPLHGFLLI